MLPHIRCTCRVIMQAHSGFLTAICRSSPRSCLNTMPNSWPQVTKLKKSKKAEPVVEVKLPDLSGSHFELPAMVRRRDEAPISSGDDVKQQVLHCAVPRRPWPLNCRCVLLLRMLALYALRAADERYVAVAQVRDRNRVAAAEAERRKDLRRVALEKRRTKVWCL